MCEAVLRPTGWWAEAWSHGSMITAHSRADAWVLNGKGSGLTFFWAPGQTAPQEIPGLGIPALRGILGASGTSGEQQMVQMPGVRTQRPAGIVLNLQF